MFYPHKKDFKKIIILFFVSVSEAEVGVVMSDKSIRVWSLIQVLKHHITAENTDAGAEMRHISVTGAGSDLPWARCVQVVDNKIIFGSEKELGIIHVIRGHNTRRENISQ